VLLNDKYGQLTTNQWANVLLTYSVDVLCVLTDGSEFFLLLWLALASVGFTRVRVSVVGGKTTET